MAGSPQIKEEKFYKSLEVNLTRINHECIAMNEGEKSASVQITYKVLAELIKKMKEASKLFEWLFNKITHVGSYFDGLRVKEATEFDINVVLKLPLHYEKFVVNRPPNFPGYVVVNLANSKLSDEKLAKHQNETEEIFKWTNKNGFLSHRLVLQWWESVFSKLQGPTILHVNDSEYKITGFKKSGPAMTAHISGKNVDIDVDLVPVIEFSKKIQPPLFIREHDQTQDWYIVPKPIEENELLWRLSFPEQEKKIMNGLQKLKMVNRFLKRIRDVFEWRPLTSYYIKTIFLWEAFEKREIDDEAFFTKNLGFLLSYFLGKLQFYLEQRKLPFFWDSEMNLFSRMKRSTMEGYAGRIKRIREKMDKYISDSNQSELDKLTQSLFYPQKASSVNGSDTNSQGYDPPSLIDLELTPSEHRNLSQSSSESSNLINFASSTELFFDSVPVSLSTPSDTQESGISTTSCSKCSHEFENAKEKSTLEIEECKLRVQIAEIDLQTAKMNLKAAQKRYEKIVLEYNRVI